MKKIIFLIIAFSLFSCNEKPEENKTIQLPVVEDNWEYNPATEWKSISCAKAGVDSFVVDSIDQAIQAHQNISKNYRSFIIAKNNFLVFEEYYDGEGVNQLNSLKSVTKSIMGILAGKAIELGLIESVDQKISDFFPEYFEDVGDSLKKEIRIKNLLTMSAGFKWNNFGGKYRSGWDLYKGNRHEYMITKTVMEDTPGEVYNYNSGLSHMLSGIITNESGMRTNEFAEKYLFDSLGISNYKWTTDRNGYNLGNSELFLTSRDMAKIGLLVLKKGYWFDKQLIDSVYIKEMLATQIETEGIGKEYSQYFGYQWWVKEYKDVVINFGAGYGGQYIFVIPKFDLVLVFTTHWNRRGVSFKPLEFVEMVVNAQLNQTTN
ncbi:MAG: serine hydrolase [Melioribacteraceae bacterium]|nr:serine hydrolase [Melioribacteraceae bacterium]